MVAGRYGFEPLANHDRTDFSCGSDVLDTYLKRQASQDQRRLIAACYVLVDKDLGRVAGYYTLSAGSVEFEALPSEVSARLPRYPQVPVVRLGRLAVDARYQGQGLGRLLLVDALLRAFGVVAQVAAYAVVVDAKNEEAALFYERFGFQRLSDKTLTLFLPFAT
ncbi:MAG: GNAT family N-acetyltransferase, partial [Dehalococcoidia bacterium]|nr:GNAT family N-acetyltransferase [Dehalococcoidia bacterium]